MKKIISALLAVIMCFIFVGCSANGNSEAVLEQLTDFSTTAVSSDGATIVAEKGDTDEGTATTANIATEESSSKNNNESSAPSKSNSADNGGKSENSSGKSQKVSGSSAGTTKHTTTAKSNTTSQTKTKTKAQNKPNESICYITIDCTKILDYIDQHSSNGYQQYIRYIPKSGYIIHNYKCTYKSGDTAYDILKRACDENDIKISATDTAYGIYVAGINNIYEKSFGKYSGWMYSVNGTPPPISCGKQQVAKNDEIIFYYTC